MSGEPNVFHVFTDATLVPAAGNLSGRYGPSAVGVVFFDPTGKVVLEDAKFIGQHTNNQAELLAIHNAIMFAIERLPNPARASVFVHTDSRLAYRGIKFNELHEPRLVKIRDSINLLHSIFHEVDYRKEPRDSLGIRRAEHVARKCLAKATGRRLRHRGRKGGKRHAQKAARNPFKGELV